MNHQSQQTDAAAAAMFGPMAGFSSFMSPAVHHSENAAAAAAFSMPGDASVAVAIAAAAQQAAVLAAAFQQEGKQMDAKPATADPTADQFHSEAAELDKDGTPAAPEESALVSHLSDIGVDCDGEVADTASSPAMHAALAALAAKAKALRNATATMTGGNGALKAGGLPRRPPVIAKTADSAGPEGPVVTAAEGSLRSKRPRRAASGGVTGAIAAATSDWGLDLISPPLKRSASNPETSAVLGKGTAAAARHERNALLRQALQNEAAIHRVDDGDDEVDAISALVSLNSQG